MDVKLTRKSFLECLGLLAAGGYGLVSDSESMVSFARAKEESSLRKSYVGGVVNRVYVPDYVSEITYVGDYVFLKSFLGSDEYLKKCMGTVPIGDTVDLSKKGINSRIFVLPGTFDSGRIGSDLEFKLKLVDHEMRHAMRFFFGFDDIGISHEDFVCARGGGWVFDISGYNTLFEIDAYYNEMKNPGFFNTSMQYRKNTLERFLTHYDSILSLNTIKEDSKKKILLHYCV